MSKYLLDYDPETKTKEVIHLDGTGKSVVQSLQDCTDVLAYNAMHEGMLDKSKDWWFVGSIPMATCMKWAQESGTRPFSKEWQEIAKRNLRDPDYFRLNPNRIRL